MKTLFLDFDEEKIISSLPSTVPLFPLDNVVFFPNTILPLHIFEERYKKKVYEIGNIIRKEILNFKATIDVNSKNKKLKILILGGSQAAKIFAETLPEIFKKCNEINIPIKIYQQCLPEQNKILSSFYSNLKIEEFFE